MKISFLITVHNEFEDLKRLLYQLVEYTDKNDSEIVIVDDYSTNEDTVNLLESLRDKIIWKQHHLNKQFGKHKQFGNEQCSGNYVFQIDADEYLNQDFLDNLIPLLDSNPEVGLFMVPRVNRIKGLTAENASRWGWRLNVLDDLTETRNDLTTDEYDLLKSNGLILNEQDGCVTFKSVLINWPDYQFRLYRNSPTIKWERDLHELIVGAEKVTHLPAEDYTWALFHDKSIERQESQNMFYINNFSKELNVRK